MLWRLSSGDCIVEAMQEILFKVLRCLLFCSRAEHRGRGDRITHNAKINVAGINTFRIAVLSWLGLSVIMRLRGLANGRQARSTKINPSFSSAHSH